MSGNDYGYHLLILGSRGQVGVIIVVLIHLKSYYGTRLQEYLCYEHLPKLSHGKEKNTAAKELYLIFVKWLPISFL